MVQNGADVNYSNSNGDSILTMLSKNKNMKIIDMLLSYGADINHKNKVGDTLFTCACKYDNKILFNYMLTKDIDINVENNYGHTGLMYMCMIGNIENVKSLIKRGVNINHINKHRDTALTFACAAGHIEIVKLLLANGVVINNKIDYDTMFILTYHNNHKNIIKFLTSAGYDINKLCDIFTDSKRILLCLYDYDKFIHNSLRFNEVEIVKFSSNGCIDYMDYTICKKNIMSVVNIYMQSDEYNILRKEIFEPISSHIFSYIVLVSDNYYSITCK